MTTPRRECAHERFSAHVGVQRLTDDAGRVRNFIAEVQVSCMDCGEPFHFLCRDTGFSFTRPTVNVGATMLQAPIAPGEAALPDHIRFETPRPAGSES
jgi:hypothetical protein